MSEEPEQIKSTDRLVEKTRLVESATPESIPDILDAASDPAKMIGQIVAENYEILEFVGEGGMSQVYLADHQLLDQKFAVKFISRKLLYDQKSLVRFHNEAKAASQLSHSNICNVREFGVLDGERPFMIMEYLRGQSLADFIKAEGKLPMERAMRIFLQVLEGVAYAHGKGVIHRDLKPHNIVFDNNSTANSVKVVDFGIAKVIRDDAEGPNLTQTGEVFGTPNYMSPEQCQGRSVTQKSDIYSLGCVLHEMLVGRPPFSGENAVDTLMKQINEPFSRHKELPKPLNTILERCLAKEPSQRYESIDDLRADLTAFQQGDRIKAAPLSGRQRKKLVAWLITISVVGCAGIASASWFNSFKTPWGDLEYQAIQRHEARQSKEALNLIDKAIGLARSHDQPADVLLMLSKDRARIAFESQNYFEARDAYKEAARLAKETGDLDDYENQLSLVCGIDERLGEYQAQRKHSKDWLTSIEQRLGPDAEEKMLPLIYRGKALYRLNRKAEANDCYSEIIRLAAINPGKDEGSLATAHWLLGISLSKQGKHQEGLAQLDKALPLARKIWSGGDQPRKIEKYRKYIQEQLAKAGK